MRDLLQAPWLQVKNDLPEDGEAELFNKIGDALDVSHVQMTRFMQAANVAMRHVMGVELLRHELPPAHDGALLGARGGHTHEDVSRRQWPIQPPEPGAQHFPRARVRRAAGGSFAQGAVDRRRQRPGPARTGSRRLESRQLPSVSHHLE